MTPERHRQISDVFQQVAELPDAQRAVELDRLCTGDDDLRREVESLLGHHHEHRDEFHESNVGVGRQLVSAPGPPSPELPSHIGRFRIIRRIGEGGMGVVFEAQQDNPRRTVALKVIRAGLASDSVVRRFRHEAEVLGRLQHPGIADIYDAGVAETPLGTQPYFAMQLIHGQPLVEYARKRALDTRVRLELFARVCDAVQYAHQRGIIHRDLKPANVLVDASGQPKILDFGVARVNDDALTIATMQTVTGQVIGTLPYMSPEQVSGRAGDVDTRSDVYSLGVSLYELLAGRLPYKIANCTLPEAARIIADVEPTHLSTIDRRFRGDIETIVFKTLQKDRAQRYQSVAELAADIRRYLADEPVLARPPSAMYQLRKFARRHTGLVVGTLAVFVSLVIGIAGIAWFAAGESRQRAAAEAASSEARRLAYRVSVGAAADAIEGGSMAAARRLLNEAPQELRGWEWRHLSARRDDSFVQIRGKPPIGGWIHVRADGDVIQRTVRCVTYASVRTGKIIREIDSAEGCTIAVNQDATAVAAVVTPTHVTLSFLDENRDAPLPDLPSPVQSLCFSADSRLLAVCDVSGAVHFFDTQTRAVLRTAQLPRPAFDMQFSPGGAWLAGTDIDNLFIIDVEAGRLMHEIASPGFRRFTQDVWTLDSQFLLRREVHHADNQYYIAPICAASGERLAPWPAHRREVVALDLAHDGQTALVAFADGLMRVSSVPGGATLLELHSEGGAAHGPALSPDGSKIAFGELGGVIRLVDRASARVVATLRGQESATSTLEFSADGHSLYSTAEDGIIRVWDVTAAGNTDVLRGHSSYVYPVAFSPDGKTLASASWDKTVRLWDMGTRRERAVLAGHTRPVCALNYSPDSLHLISTTLYGEEVFLWNLASGRYVRLPARTTEPLEIPAFTKDGKRIWLPAAASEPGPTEHIWNLETESIETVPLSALRDLADVRVSPDRRWIARRLGPQSALTLISLDNPAARRTFAQGIQHAVFDARGTRLVSVEQKPPLSADTEVSVWNVESGRHLVDLRGHLGEVFDAQFSPDGQRLATCGRDGTIRIWDGEHFEQLVRLRGHQDYVWSLAWSPDGQTLASGSGDGTVRLWRADD